MNDQVFSWDNDAPEGYEWKCPQKWCRYRATLGCNAGFHAKQNSHPTPILVKTKQKKDK